MKHALALLCCLASSVSAADTHKATFGGGCFWCLEPPFESIHGVSAVVSGYAGGSTSDPTYAEVTAGHTGHIEVVEVTYDARIVDYQALLETFWKQVDPTDAGGQFVDRGSQYRTVIFTHNEEQMALALESKRRLEQAGLFDAPIVTEILPAPTFYMAEDYHQDYYKTNALQYKFYRYRSGRDQFLDRAWAQQPGFRLFDGAALKESTYRKPSVEEIRAQLTPLQFQVTQDDGTEPPFQNVYWDQKADGIYVDIVSGEPLFSSLHKYDSGTGWPSFWQPLESSHIVERDDSKLWMNRIEVRSKFGDSHLGHVFPDGPAPTGLRYCINSASLEFIPVAKLKTRGYEKYLSQFENALNQ
ncbi:peptide-methionine (S)-S-oxide reductase MsrA [Litorivicinus sp.]|nr:peptide-methionine (S)-S-oxide reductase MsrA [Litorivicinus sp.]